MSSSRKAGEEIVVNNGDMLRSVLGITGKRGKAIDMERKNLHEHVRTLITLPVADSPLSVATRPWPLGPGRSDAFDGACGRYGGA